MEFCSVDWDFFLLVFLSRCSRYWGVSTKTGTRTCISPVGRLCSAAIGLWRHSAPWALIIYCCGWVTNVFSPLKLPVHCLIIQHEQCYKIRTHFLWSPEKKPVLRTQTCKNLGISLLSWDLMGSGLRFCAPVPHRWRLCRDLCPTSKEYPVVCAIVFVHSSSVLRLTFILATWLHDPFTKLIGCQSLVNWKYASAPLGKRRTSLAEEGNGEI